MLKEGSRVGNDETKKKILDFARQEFLARGYEGASLRKIATMANLTTGAIYGYFRDKQEMFSALVEEAAQSIYALFEESYQEFFNRDLSSQMESMPEFAELLVNLVYSRFDEFKLIVCRSRGTAYSGFLDRLSEFEEVWTYRFIEGVKEHGKLAYEPSDELIHILCSASVKSLFEVVEHDMSREKALEYIRKIYEFYESGWKHLLFHHEE